MIRSEHYNSLFLPNLVLSFNPTKMIGFRSLIGKESKLNSSHVRSRKVWQRVRRIK